MVLQPSFAGWVQHRRPSNVGENSKWAGKRKNVRSMIFSCNHPPPLLCHLWGGQIRTMLSALVGRHCQSTWSELYCIIFWHPFCFTSPILYAGIDRRACCFTKLSSWCFLSSPCWSTGRISYGMMVIDDAVDNAILEFDSCTCLGSFAIGYAPCSIVFLILGWLTLQIPAIQAPGGAQVRVYLSESHDVLSWFCRQLRIAILSTNSNDLPMNV